MNMLNRNLMIVPLLIALALGGWFVGGTVPAQAQQSEGCQFLNGGPSSVDPTYTYWSGRYSFNAGDTFKWNLTATADGPDIIGISVAAQVYMLVYTIDSNGNLDTLLTSDFQTIEQAGTVSSSGSFTIFSSGMHYIALIAQSDYKKHSGTVSCTPALSGSEPQPQPEPQPHTDNRINRWDFANPVVVYPYQDDTGEGMDIYTDEGELILRVTGADIAAVANPPATNTLIASNPDYEVTVYRLTTGELQVNARQSDGKTYVLIFDAPTPGTPHSSRTE